MKRLISRITFDLVVLSRFGDRHARNPHDGNLITFHRIPHFRQLVY